MSEEQRTHILVRHEETTRYLTIGTSPGDMGDVKSMIPFFAERLSGGELGNERGILQFLYDFFWLNRVYSLTHDAVQEDKQRGTTVNWAIYTDLLTYLYNNHEDYRNFKIVLGYSLDIAMLSKFTNQGINIIYQEFLQKANPFIIDRYGIGEQAFSAYNSMKWKNFAVPEMYRQYIGSFDLPPQLIEIDPETLEKSKMRFALMGLAGRGIGRIDTSVAPRAKQTGLAMAEFLGKNIRIVINPLLNSYDWRVFEKMRGMQDNISEQLELDIATAALKYLVELLTEKSETNSLAITHSELLKYLLRHAAKNINWKKADPLEGIEIQRQGNYLTVNQLRWEEGSYISSHLYSVADVPNYITVLEQEIKHIQERISCLKKTSTYDQLFALLDESEIPEIFRAGINHFNIHSFRSVVWRKTNKSKPSPDPVPEQRTWVTGRKSKKTTNRRR
jgi:hypothetical protein